MLARLAVLSVCLFVAACQTPAELKESPTVTTDRVHFPAGNPERLAACLVRGYENASANASTRLTPLGNGGYELVVRSEPTVTFAVYEIYPAMVEYWVDAEAANMIEPKKQIAGLINACRR